MDSPKFIVSNQREASISIKRVNSNLIHSGFVSAEASTGSNISVATVNLDGSITELEEKTIKGQKIQVLPLFSLQI